MKLKALILIATALLMAATATAQSNTSAAPDALIEKPMALPGSAWSVAGNLNPTEHGNVISSSYSEQGITVVRRRSVSLVPYVALGLSVDSKGYDWNNRLRREIGVKLIKSYEHGTISVGAAYAHELRWKSNSKTGAPIGYANYWFGWAQPTADASTTQARFPGSSWGFVGNISPVEKRNIIASTYVQQGVSVAKLRRISVIPFAEMTLSADSKGFEWNNKVIYGGGVKFVVPGKSRVAEFGASYLREDRFKTGRNAGGVAIFVKFWIGWRSIFQGKR